MLDQIKNWLRRLRNSASTIFCVVFSQVIAWFRRRSLPPQPDDLTKYRDNEEITKIDPIEHQAIEESMAAVHARVTALETELGVLFILTDALMRAHREKLKELSGPHQQ